MDREPDEVNPEEVEEEIEMGDGEVLEVLELSWGEEVREWVRTGVGQEDTWKAGVNKMRRQLAGYGGTVREHVMELYSPPRVTRILDRMGLIPGMALDLTTVDPEDGEPWDFNVPEKAVKAEAMVRSKRALLIIGSPMCTAFSSL